MLNSSKPGRYVRVLSRTIKLFEKFYEINYLLVEKQVIKNSLELTKIIVKKDETICKEQLKIVFDHLKYKVTTDDSSFL